MRSFCHQKNFPLTNAVIIQMIIDSNKKYTIVAQKLNLNFGISLNAAKAKIMRIHKKFLEKIKEINQTTSSAIFSFLSMSAFEVSDVEKTRSETMGIGSSTTLSPSSSGCAISGDCNGSGFVEGPLATGPLNENSVSHPFCSGYVATTNSEAAGKGSGTFTTLPTTLSLNSSISSDCNLSNSVDGPLANTSIIACNEILKPFYGDTVASTANSGLVTPLSIHSTEPSTFCNTSIPLSTTICSSAGMPATEPSGSPVSDCAVRSLRKTPTSSKK